jgi:preprotein translocase subunit SecE
MRCADSPFPLKSPPATRICRPYRKQAGRFMASTSPIQFMQQVRAEVAKIVWPTRREVVMTTIMVFIMATLTAVFFSLVDWIIRFGLQTIFTSF